MAKHQKTEEWHTCDICCEQCEPVGIIEIPEWHTCDVCGEQCEPVGTIEIPFAYSMDLVYTMQVRVSAYIPYATSDGDVCFKCFRKHIQKWIADQERKNGKGGKMNGYES